MGHQNIWGTKVTDRKTTGIRFAACLLLAMSLLAISAPSAFADNGVKAEFRVWEHQLGGKVEWDSDLNGKINTFALGSLPISKPGEHVVAPGTGGTYEFTIESETNAELEYAVSVNEDNEHALPIEVRMRHADGSYCVGDEATWVPIGEGVSFAGSLAAYAEQPYELDWRWTFEGDDEKDSAVGALAASDTVGYELLLAVQAEAHGREGSGNGAKALSTTGDSLHPVAFAGLGCAAIAAIVAAVAIRKGARRHG